MITRNQISNLVDRLTVDSHRTLTSERLFPGVDAHVVVEVALFPEAEVAVRAAMRLVLAVVAPVSEELEEDAELPETCRDEV